MYEKNRAWIELNREHLLHNIKELQHLAGERCELMPAVKADAYGHGDVLISSMLQDAGIRNYCTATVDEAVRLRQAGIQGQILILGYTHPDAFPELARYALTQTVVDTDYARELSEFSQKFSDYTDTRCPQESSALTDTGCPQKSSALTDAGCSHGSPASMRDFPGRTPGLPGSGGISVHIAIDTGCTAWGSLMKTWALSLRSGLCPACRSQASSHISAYRMDLRRRRNALQSSRYIGSAARPTLFTPEGSRDSRLISRAATAS